MITVMVTVSSVQVHATGMGLRCGAVCGDSDHCTDRFKYVNTTNIKYFGTVGFLLLKDFPPFFC